MNKKNIDMVNPISDKQPTAAEFLQKAKAICADRPISGTAENCEGCPVQEFCRYDLCDISNIPDLIRKAMDYEIKEDANAE